MLRNLFLLASCFRRILQSMGMSAVLPSLVWVLLLWIYLVACLQTSISERPLSSCASCGYIFPMGCQRNQKVGPISIHPNLMRSWSFRSCTQRQWICFSSGLFVVAKRISWEAFFFAGPNRPPLRPCPNATVNFLRGAKEALTYELSCWASLSMVAPVI